MHCNPKNEQRRRSLPLFVFLFRKARIPLSPLVSKLDTSSPVRKITNGPARTWLLCSFGLYFAYSKERSAQAMTTTVQTARESVSRKRFWILYAGTKMMNSSCPWKGKRLLYKKCGSAKQSKNFSKILMVNTNRGTWTGVNRQAGKRGEPAANGVIL